MDFRGRDGREHDALAPSERREEPKRTGRNDDESFAKMISQCRSFLNRQTTTRRPLSPNRCMFVDTAMKPWSLSFLIIAAKVGGTMIAGRRSQFTAIRCDSYMGA